MLTSLSSATSATTTDTSSKTKVADMDAAQDRFLKLLVAQLNNQDPMNPMDNAQMTSQMAQINTVTSVQQVNETLQSMAQQFSAMQVLQGSSMVGHEVLLEGNTLSIVDGAAKGSVDLSARAENVSVDILTPGGMVIDTVHMGALEPGRHDFSWDASNYQGTSAPSFRINATLGGQPIANTALTRAKVTGVGSDAGTLQLQLQGRPTVAYDAIAAIL
ncbi:flagellar hook assembly protein FlgD [Candidatus Symbiobacter mobilis]|uniref:Basal-body rod modification protein FlgD n=1 Tax=Candidatus Symbiobacter mobilis CR TaxID=946483 RepID=U5N7Q7_9BURK|nr:flagellar hook capping FlgD N-terminal domain-containing protein [Candidatus Symbiobacter mobilis]AGX87407.1 flagellar basal body rod modification protein FlgD [Candidatus Symbiobacter mobilis CR]